jgi:hypothetical protein
MKKMLITTLSLLSLTSFSYATTEKPEKCPDASAISAVPIMMAIEVGHGYNAISSSQFDTDQVWTFVIMGIDVDSTEEAMKRANQLLPQLSGHPIPQPVPDDIWMCAYDLGNEYSALALYPLSLDIKKIPLKQH